MIRHAYSLAYIQTKLLIQKDTCIPMFITALSSRAKTWKLPKCPSTEELVTKMWHTHKGTLSHNKDEIMPFAATCMQPQIIILSEGSQRKTNTIYITYTWNLKWHRWTYLWTKIIENRLVIAKGSSFCNGGRMEWELGLGRFKLLYRQWIPSSQITALL